MRRVAPALAVVAALAIAVALTTPVSARAAAPAPSAEGALAVLAMIPARVRPANGRDRARRRHRQPRDRRRQRGRDRLPGGPRGGADPGCHHRVVHRRAPRLPPTGADRRPGRAAGDRGHLPAGSGDHRRAWRRRPAAAGDHRCARDRGAAGRHQLVLSQGLLERMDRALQQAPPGAGGLVCIPTGRASAPSSLRCSSSTARTRSRARCSCDAGARRSGASKPTTPRPSPSARRSPDRDSGEIDAVKTGLLERLRIPGVGISGDAERRIGMEHAGDLARRQL